MDGSVDTCVRFRPSDGWDSSVSIASGEKSVLVRTSESKELRLPCTAVLKPDASQAETFDALALPVLEGAVRGQSGTILMYGQTGAGKTHTMSGSPDGGYAERGLIPRTIEWLLRHAARDEREAPGSEPSTSSVSWTVRLSALEIYNEHLLDLLDDSVSGDPMVHLRKGAGDSEGTRDAGLPEGIPVGAGGLGAADARRAGLRGPALAFGRATAGTGGSLRIVAGADGGVEVRGLRRPVLGSAEGALELLSQAESARAIAAHSLNDRSTRSHCVVTLHLRRARMLLRRMKGGEEREVEEVLWAKVHLVDLAGSERIAKTGSEGRTLEEATHINKSLSALQQVVLALGSGKGRGGKERKAEAEAGEGSGRTKAGSSSSSSSSREHPQAGHIPYRRSVLTQYLRDSLGGNCFTRLVACVWPSRSHSGESVATLRFAARMLRVRNRPVRNIAFGGGEGGGGGGGAAEAALRVQVRELKDEVRMLRQELSLHDELTGRVGVRHRRPRAEEVEAVGGVVRRLLEEHRSKCLELGQERAAAAGLHGAVKPRAGGPQGTAAAAEPSMDAAAVLSSWDEQPASAVWGLRSARELHLGIALLLREAVGGGATGGAGGAGGEWEGSRGRPPSPLGRPGAGGGGSAEAGIGDDPPGAPTSSSTRPGAEGAGAAGAAAGLLSEWKAGAGAARVAAFERAGATVRAARARAEELAGAVNRKKEEVDLAAAALREARTTGASGGGGGGDDSGPEVALRAAQTGYKKKHAQFQDAREELMYVRGQAKRAKAAVEAGFQEWIERRGGGEGGVGGADGQ